jgi:hypothetical protein
MHYDRGPSGWLAGQGPSAGATADPLPPSRAKVIDMARKVLNRKELREESDAAEREGKAKKKVAKPTDEEGKKKPVKRKSRSKTPKEVRLKAFSAKTPHFIQPVKEVIEE